MTDLITTLKDEHRQLKELLDRVKALGITSEAGRKCLRDARRVFTDHIRHEDREFYPQFLAAAAGHADAEGMARKFADEMKGISADILGFFDKYRDGGDGMEYARDFGRLSSALFLRWRKEEDILYARFTTLRTRAAA